MKELRLEVRQDWKSFLQYDHIFWQEEYNQKFCFNIPLLYETAFINNLQTFKPWENRSETINGVFHEWNYLKNELHEKFSNREKTTVIPLMKRGIGFLVEVIYWSNHIPALFELKDLERLEIKPVNFQERLHYILSYPGKYQSYVQLVELFSEMEKLFQKSLLFEQKKLSQTKKGINKKHPNC